jgi:aryl-alcohol dehydrogenase-like predicted oxidoreductase
MFPTLKVHLLLSVRSARSCSGPQMFGVGSIAWSPLARGVVCRPFGKETLRKNTDQYQENAYADNAGAEAIVNRCARVLRYVMVMRQC